MTKTRRDPLTRARVVEAALALADAEGIDGLTMRRLATALGVEAMSLYNHVRNKEALLGLMLDAVAGEIARPGPGDWRAEMRARALSMHESLMRHPWAAPLMVSHAEPGPNMLALVEATLGCLVGAGFSYPMADHAWNAIDGYVHGVTLQRLRFPFAPETYAEVAAAYLPAIDPATHPHLRALTALVATREHDGLQDIRFGLDLLLDGLERLRT